MTSLVFDVLYRDHGAQKGLQSLGRESENVGRSYSKLKVAGAAALLAVGAAAIKFGKDSVAAYSDASTQQAKLAFAFQKFPALADTSQAALQKYNSQLQLKTKYDDDAIASGQSVLAQFHLTGKQLTEVTPLLLDYATKTGKDLPTAAKLLGQSFIGNTKALKQIGVNYKSTGDQAKDFSNVTGLLRQQVGGLAENEGKTAAGQLAILKNQFGELEETAGQKLLPAVIGITKGLTNMAVAVGNNADVIIPLVGGVAGLAGTIWLAQKATVAWKVATELNAGIAAAAVKGLGALKLAFTGVEITAEASGRAMRIAQLSIPVVGIALFAVTTAMAAFAAKGDDAASTATDFSSAMEGVEGNVTLATAALNENVRATAVKSLQDKGAYDQAKLLGLAYSDVTDAALGNKDAIERVNVVLAANKGLSAGSGKANADLRNAADGLAGTMGTVAHSARDAADAEKVRRGAMEQSVPAVETQTELAGKLKDANRALRVELQKVVDKLTILKNGALDQERANEAWESAVDGLTKSVKDNGKTLDIHTEKGRANRSAIINAMTALDDKTKADYKSAAQQRDSAKAVAQANKRYQDNKRDLERAAIAAGYSKGEVKKMIAQYLKTPKQLRTDIKTPGVDKAQAEAVDLKRKYDAVPNKVNTTANLTFRNNAGQIVTNLNKSFQLVKGGPRLSYAVGGVIPGYTPGRDVHDFYSPTGGRLALSGGEAVMRPEWTRAVGGPQVVNRWNADAKAGKLHLASGGIWGRYEGATINANSREGSSGSQMYGWGVVQKLKGAMAYAKEHGDVRGGGYAAALRYAEAHKGHPYIFGSLWDCSGFMSALHSIILGQKPHRRYVTQSFHGAHSNGFTQGKHSAFMVGVRPLSGKLGHMAGTLNGKNVESAGGVGVRVGGGARGYNNGMFSWRGGLADGGVIGDLPFDLLDPMGQHYDPRLRALLPGLAGGGVMRRPSTVNMSERGPERVLTVEQNRNFEQLAQRPQAMMAEALSGLKLSGELTLRDGKAYVEGITLSVLGKENRRAEVAF